MEEQQKELDGKWLQEGVQRMMVMLESDSRNESFARVAVAAFLSQLNPGVKVVLRAKLAGKIEFSLLVFMDKPGNVIGDRVASAVYQRVQRFFPVLLFHAEVVQLSA